MTTLPSAPDTQKACRQSGLEGAAKLGDDPMSVGLIVGKKKDQGPYVRRSRWQKIRLVTRQNSTSALEEEAAINLNNLPITHLPVP